MVVVVSVFRNATSNAIQVMWPPALTSCFLANITLHQDVTSLSCCIQIPYTLFSPPQNTAQPNTDTELKMLMTLCANTSKIGMRRTIASSRA